MKNQFSEKRFITDDLQKTRGSCEVFCNPQKVIVKVEQMMA